MDKQPTLENDLVRIRPMLDKDLAPLYRVAKDPLIWQQHHVNRYQRNIFEEFFKESMDSGGALIIMDKVSGEIIGSSRYHLIDGFPEGIEIGWTFLARDYWGGTYNRSIKKLMMDYVFKYIDYVILNIHKDNIRSQKAAENIGGKKLTNSERKNIPRKNQDTLTYFFNKKPS